MNDFRIVCCEGCNGEGSTPRNWDDAPVMCQWCDGTGREVIQVQPVGCEDLEEMGGCP